MKIFTEGARISTTSPERKRRASLPSLALRAGCAALFLAGPAFAAPLPAKPVTVPFELLRSGHMAVQVKVNGKGPYRLVFDTGAPITLISTKLARESGLIDKAGPRSPFPLFAAAEARIGKLEVGGQAAENIQAVVMDHPTVDAMARVLGPLEGIVGFPFFARFKTTLDYQAKTLTFEPNGYKPPDVMRAITAALLASSDEVKILAPAGQWGLTVAKEKSDDDAGLTIKAVLAGSPAAAAGFKPDDRLLTVEDRWTDTLGDLYSAAAGVKPGTTAVVKVRRDGKELELRIKPGTGL